MEHTKIEGLLERYWEGETTLTEERQLKHYFQSGNVDARFKDVAPLFQTLSAAQQIAAPVSLGTSIQPIAMQVSYSKNWLRIAAAAVVVGVLSTTYWWLTSKPQDTNQVVQTETHKASTPIVKQPKAPESTKDLVVVAPVVEILISGDQDSRAILIVMLLHGNEGHIIKGSAIRALHWTPTLGIGTRSDA